MNWFFYYTCAKVSISIAPLAAIRMCGVLAFRRKHYYDTILHYQQQQQQVLGAVQNICLVYVTGASLCSSLVELCCRVVRVAKDTKRCQCSVLYSGHGKV